MQIAVAVRPVAPVERVVALAQRAETLGLHSFWLYDAPPECMDPFPLLALIARATTRIRLGPCVINPVTRTAPGIAMEAATLQEIAAGRLLLGMGRGDVGVRRLGMQPASVEELDRAIRDVREAHAKIRWASHPIPIWVGTYGPRGLGLAGRAADGVILQFADPTLVRWALDHLGEAAELEVMAAAAVSADFAGARWFVRMIGGDLRRLLARGHLEDADLAAWGAEDGEAPDRLVERLCLTGDAAAMRLRLEALEACGVGIFNAFLIDDEEAGLETLGALTSPSPRR